MPAPERWREKSGTNTNAERNEPQMAPSVLSAYARPTAAPTRASLPATADREEVARITSEYDLVAVPVTDPREVRLPNVGLIELEDAETGEMVLVDTSSAAVRKRYERLGRERSEKFRELFASMGVDRIEVMTDKDYVSRLVQFFRARERRY